MPPLRYIFELYADEALTEFEQQAETDAVQWQVAESLIGGRWYYWQAQAIDEHDRAGPWMELASFYVQAHFIRGDVSHDGSINIADPVAILAYLFAGGDLPPSPFPECGSDSTEDDLDCVSASECE